MEGMKWCLFVALGVAAAANAQDSGLFLQRALRAELAAELGPFVRGAAPGPGPSEYLRFYGLPMAEARYSAGTLESAGVSIALHSFDPPARRGVVVLAHGYYDHAGSLAHLIQRLVAEGYAVIAYDQPGHGLSGGEAGSIDSFATYAAVLRDVIGLALREFGGPCHFVGFSLGAAGGIELLTQGDAPEVHGVVLLAPLLRSSFWNVSRLGYHLSGQGEVLVRRVFARNSSDEEYLQLVRRDPLQLTYVSRRWFRALLRWNEALETRPPSTRRVLVVQGTNDLTVAWRHNLRELRRLFPNAVVKTLPGARHQLPNEAQALREHVLAAVVDYLAATDNP